MNCFPNFLQTTNTLNMQKFLAIVPQHLVEKKLFLFLPFNLCFFFCGNMTYCNHLTLSHKEKEKTLKQSQFLAK